jgi:monoterpene epsilon-lactone hydrolase
MGAFTAHFGGGTVSSAPDAVPGVRPTATVRMPMPERRIPVPSPESLAVRARLAQMKAAARAGPSPSLAEQRRALEAMAANLALPADVRVTRTAVGGVPAEWVVAAAARPDRTFLYFHGGAYYMGSAASHRELAARLSRAAAARVLLAEYRLAPEHRFPGAVHDAVAAYRGLLAQGTDPSRLLVGGDSAGGGLTVAMLVVLRDAGDPLPQAAVLLSPWTDLACTGPSLKTRAAADPWLDPEGIRRAPALYLGATDPRHPLASPLYADLRGLPPLLVHVGRDECLLDDSTRLAERARAAGVDVSLVVWDDMWHVFHSFAAEVPEARRAIEEIGAFAARMLP